MAVRNFWMEANIDGRSTVLSGGPKGRWGGMEINLYQRKDGAIAHIAVIKCTASGKLRTEIMNGDDAMEVVYSKVITDR